MAELHTAAFYESITPAVTANAVNIVADGVFSRASDTGLYVPAGMQLVGAHGAITGGATSYPRLQVNAPSLLRIGYPNIRPLDAAPGAGNPNFQSLLDRPIVFPNNEVLGLDATWSAAVGGATGVYGLLFFRGKQHPLPPGDAFWIRASATPSITTANVWVQVNPSWDITLPEGTYAVVGFEHINATAPAAARLVFPGSPWRPGTVSVNVGQRTHAAFYEGQFGVFGTFAAFAPPSMEVLVSAATSNLHEFYLRVVKL